MEDILMLSNDSAEDITAEIPKAKIAYLILVHRLPDQFKKLFKAIYHSDNYYLIHVDKKSPNSIHKDVLTFLLEYPNVSILQSTNVIWGGYSMVQAELNGIKRLLSFNIEWDYFINLSGQDYPLKSQEEIQIFLGGNKNNFINVLNQKKDRPNTLNRIKYYYAENEFSVSEAKFRRSYIRRTIPYIGTQWMILTRSCCEFICNNNEVKNFESYYANTLIADESFFQTVLMNTSFSEPIVNDDKRAIIWIPDGAIKLRPKTFTMSDLMFLNNSDAFFARKFDDSVDGSISDSLELRFNSDSKKELLLH